MPDDRVEPVLALMAKSPVPHRAKTRLMPELSAQEAADVSALLVRMTVELAVDAWPGPVYLLCWPDSGHACFRDIAARTRVALGVQAAGDLGDKMNSVICGFTAAGRPAAVMGCDVPHCPPEQLKKAYDLLSQGENVIGPCVDGGYYLIGLQSCQPILFSRIRWGKPDVLQSTLRRAADLDTGFSMLIRLRDIDDYGDLRSAMAQLPPLRRWLR